MLFSEPPPSPTTDGAALAFRRRLLHFCLCRCAAPALGVIVLWFFALSLSTRTPAACRGTARRISAFAAAHLLVVLLSCRFVPRPPSAEHAAPLASLSQHPRTPPPRMPLLAAAAAAYIVANPLLFSAVVLRGGIGRAPPPTAAALAASDSGSPFLAASLAPVLLWGFAGVLELLLAALLPLRFAAPLQLAVVVESFASLALWAPSALPLGQPTALAGLVVLFTFFFDAVLFYSLKELLLAFDSEASTTNLLAYMSHEVRNPLNVLLGFLDIVRSRIGPELPRELKTPRVDLAAARTDLDTAWSSGLQIRRIIDDLVDQQHGRLVFSLAPINLAALVAEIMREAAALFGRATVRLVSHIDDPERNAYAFLGDAGRIKQVIHNLLSNASKHTTHGEVALRVVVVPDDSKHIPHVHGSSPSRVLFEVSDTGSGIPAAQQHLLFRPFQKLSASPGFGFGLFLCRRITRRMEGDLVLVHSVPGRTTFRLDVPLLPVPHPRSRSSEDMSLSSPLGSMRSSFDDAPAMGAAGAGAGAGGGDGDGSDGSGSPGGGGLGPWGGVGSGDGGGVGSTGAASGAPEGLGGGDEVASFFQVDGELVDVTTAACDLLGVTRPQFLSRSSRDPQWQILAADGSPLTAAEYPTNVAARTGKPLESLFGVYNPLRHDYVWMTISAIPLFLATDSHRPWMIYATMIPEPAHRPKRLDLLPPAQRAAYTAAAAAEAADMPAVAAATAAGTAAASSPPPVVRRGRPVALDLHTPASPTRSKRKQAPDLAPEEGVAASASAAAPAAAAASPDRARKRQKETPRAARARLRGAKRGRDPEPEPGPEPGRRGGAMLRRRGAAGAAAGGGHGSGSRSDVIDIAVLVVDDQNLNCRILERSLRNLGVAHIECARNGLEAVQKARERRFDAILLDVMMPVMGGIEAAVQILADRPDTSIFALTGNVGEADAERCRHAGMKGVLRKPLSFQALRQAIDSLQVGAS